MIKRERRTTEEARLIDVNDLMAYLGIGRDAAANFGKSCGAQIHFGRRCLYDKRIIDQALNNMQKGGKKENGSSVDDEVKACQ